MAYCVIDLQFLKSRPPFLADALLPHVAIHQGHDLVTLYESARRAGCSCRLAGNALCTGPCIVGRRTYASSRPTPLHNLKEGLMHEPFRLDLEAIRARAREKMGEGAVTGAYQADRERVVAVLNEVLATELV